MRSRERLTRSPGVLLLRVHLGFSHAFPPLSVLQGFAWAKSKVESRAVGLGNNLKRKNSFLNGARFFYHEMA